MAGFAFEKAAPGCAHNLCAHCAQIPHLPGVVCFVRCTRHRTKPIHTLFRRARRNSTRFLTDCIPEPTRAQGFSRLNEKYKKSRYPRFFVLISGGRCVTLSLPINVSFVMTNHADRADAEPAQCAGLSFPALGMYIQKRRSLSPSDPERLCCLHAHCTQTGDRSIS